MGNEQMRAWFKKHLEEGWDKLSIEELEKLQNNWMVQDVIDRRFDGLVLHNPPRHVSKKWLDEFVAKKKS